MTERLGTFAGSCGILCAARLGYDYVTGLGTPIGTAVIPALVEVP